MKKTRSHLTWMPACAGMGIVTLIAATPAHAQYIDYNYNKPTVEMNLDIIGYGATTENPAAAPVQPVEQQPVEQPAAVPPPPPQAFPEPIVSAPVQEPPAPVRKKLVLKPVFTETEPLVEAEEIEQTAPPAPAPSPVRAEAEKPAPRKIPVAERPALVIIEEEDEKNIPLPPSLPEKKQENTPSQKTSSSAVPLPADLGLAFSGNESAMTPEIQQKLDAVAKQLSDLPGMRLQVRAYATGEDGNTSSARRISLSRALSVRSYLMDKGIKPNRIDVRALGTETDRAPLDRVDMVFAR